MDVEIAKSSSPQGKSQCLSFLLSRIPYGNSCNTILFWPTFFFNLEKYTQKKSLEKPANWPWARETSNDYSEDVVSLKYWKFCCPHLPSLRLTKHLKHWWGLGLEEVFFQVLWLFWGVWCFDVFLGVYLKIKLLIPFKPFSWGHIFVTIRWLHDFPLPFFWKPLALRNFLEKIALTNKRIDESLRNFGNLRYIHKKRVKMPRLEMEVGCF